MDPRRQPVYISVDCEFDGPEPVNNSLMSIGAVAYRYDGKELGRFYMNLLPLPQHEASQETTERFWNDFPDAFSASQVDRRDPQEVMQTFADWVNGFTGQAVLAAQPLAVEDKWLTDYFQRFNVESPFKDKLCMRQQLMDAMEMLGPNEPVPDSWLSTHPYTHIAIDDATHQGETFVNIKRWVETRQQEASQSR